MALVPRLVPRGAQSFEFKDFRLKPRLAAHLDEDGVCGGGGVAAAAAQLGQR